MLTTPLSLFPLLFLHTCKKRVHISGYSKSTSFIQRFDGCLKGKTLTPREKIRIHLCCHWQRKPDYHTHTPERVFFQFGLILKFGLVWFKNKKGEMGHFLAQDCLKSGQEGRKCILCAPPPPQEKCKKKKKNPFSEIKNIKQRMCSTFMLLKEGRFWDSWWEG